MTKHQKSKGDGRNVDPPRYPDNDGIPDIKTVTWSSYDEDPSPFVPSDTEEMIEREKEEKDVVGTSVNSPFWCPISFELEDDVPSDDTTGSWVSPVTVLVSYVKYTLVTLKFP